MSDVPTGPDTPAAGGSAARPEPVVPLPRHPWVRWADLALLFTRDGAAGGWFEDRERLDDAVRDPWYEA